VGIIPYFQSSVKEKEPAEAGSFYFWMEIFFGHLKSELCYLQEFVFMEHFKAELVAYIDYYNNRRIKAGLKGLPPALHRQQALLAA